MRWPRRCWLLPAFALLGSWIVPSESFSNAICDSCQTMVDTCCAKKPAFQDTAYSNRFTGGVTVGTAQGILPGDTVVTVFDILHNPPPLNTNWAPMNRYAGPPTASGTGSWTLDSLGTVFGLTIDGGGNIYVCHASLYNGDAVGNVFGGGPGAVYKIDGNTGKISVFAKLPNFPDPTITPPDNLPGLGNISFDCKHHQFFVTNMEDGMIYRLSATGAVLSTYDPGANDNGLPGFAPLGERLWGVQWHDDRVYYSVWNRDLGHASTTPNVVRSIGLAPSGDFDGFTDRLEVVVPAYPGFGNVSGPVSDISFSPNGRMLIGERAMNGPSSSSAHQARALEYVCREGLWVPNNTYSIGVFSNTNSAGGVDYDYAIYSGGVPGRVWVTGDALHYPSTYSDYIYGMQGLPPTGGTIANSYLIDYNGDVNNADKFQIGDVEVPCPPATTQLGSICGCKFHDVNGSHEKDPNEPCLPGWTIVLSGPVSATMTTDASGNYCFTNLPPGVYTVTEITQPGWIQTSPSGGSYTVTINGNNRVLDFGNRLCATDPCVAAPSGMVSWWPLDETQGTTAHDLVGPNTGAWVGNPTVNVGQYVNNSLHFDTVNDFVQVPPTNLLNFGTGDFSIDAWIHSPIGGGGVRIVVDKRSGGAPTESGYSLYLNANRLGCLLADGAGETAFESTSPSLMDENWHHVAVTVQRNNPSGGLRLFVDGAVIVRFDPTVRAGSLSNFGPLRIGYATIPVPGQIGFAQPFYGDIDEVEIFSRSLDSLEVQSIYHAGMAGKCKPCCHVPPVRSYCQNQTSLTLCFQLCNNDWSQPAGTFSWTLAGLPLSLPMCTVNGPTSFSPSSGQVTIAAGGTQSVCVTVQRPPGLVLGKTACYQLTVQNQGTGKCFICTGKLRATNNKMCISSATGPTIVPLDGSATVGFTIMNDDIGGDLSYSISGESSDGDSGSLVLRLNSLPPGTPVTGTRFIGPNDSTVVSVDVAYSRYQTDPAQNVVLSVDLDGTGALTPVMSVGVEPGAGTADVKQGDVPSGSLDKAIGYPNPFERSTGVHFTLAATQKVRVGVYDVNGRLLKNLYSGEMTAGPHYLPWDGMDTRGWRVGSGIYFLRVKSGDRTLTTKVVRVE